MSTSRKALSQRRPEGSTGMDPASRTGHVHPADGSRRLTGRVFPLWILEAVWVVGRPLKMVPWRKILLHKPRREATKVVWWRWGLIKGRGLLVWRERPSEMWRSLFESAQQQGEISNTTEVLQIILPLNTWKTTFLLFLNEQKQLKHACMRGGNVGSRWPQGGWSGWFPHGGCCSKDPGPPQDGGPGSDPPGPLQRPASLGGPPLQFPCSLWSFHMPSWLFQGGQGGGGWFGSKEGWGRGKSPFERSQRSKGSSTLLPPVHRGGNSATLILP